MDERWHAPIAATVPCASGNQMGTSHLICGAHERATSGGPVPGNCGTLDGPAGGEVRLECDTSVWSVSRLAAPPIMSDKPSCEGLVDMWDGAVLGEYKVGGEGGGTAVMRPRFIALMSHADRGPAHMLSQSRSDVLCIFAGIAGSGLAAMPPRELVMLSGADT